MRKKRAEAAQAGETDSHANFGDGQVAQNEQVFRFLHLSPRAILVRCFTKDRLKQPNEMKARETGNPSCRADGNRFVLPIPQEIARMAESAQKFCVYHLSRTTIISVAPPEVVGFERVRCPPVPADQTQTCPAEQTADVTKRPRCARSPCPLAFSKLS